MTITEKHLEAAKRAFQNNDWLGIDEALRAALTAAEHAREPVEGSDFVSMPHTPTDEMVRYAVYNVNRKYSHNPVDDLIVRKVFSALRHSRPAASVPPAAPVMPMEPIEDAKVRHEISQNAADALAWLARNIRGISLSNWMQKSTALMMAINELNAIDAHDGWSAKTGHSAMNTRWRHVKTDGEYTVIGQCRIEATNTPAIAYRNQDGVIWVRPKDEFFDGRFERIAPPCA